MMKKVKFNPNGERIKIEFTFEGLIVASYSFTLWEAQSNYRIIYETGNNQNMDDDSYQLPLPVGNNNGRLIQLRTEFVGLDSGTNKDYRISAKIYQGEEFLGEDFDTGKITGSTQSSLIYIKLTS